MKVNYRHWKRVLPLSSLTLLGGVAVACVWYGTALGVGISSDSTEYVGSARSLLAGQGLTVRGAPLTQFPPLFPALLAIGGWFGPDPAVVARWLNALLLGANVFLMGYAIHRTTGALWTAWLGGALMLAAGDIVEPHMWAWSEPAMLFFALSGFLSLCLYFEEQRLWRLALAAASLALAVGARYAAIPLVGSAILGILLFRPGRVWGRLKDAFVVTVMSCGPIALWLLRNRLVAGSSTNRHFVTHWILPRHFNAARATGARWFNFGAGELTVERQNTILLVALGLLLMLLAVLIWKTARPNRSTTGTPLMPRLPWLLLIYGVSYCAFLVVSISFFDFNTPLDERILSPLHFALIGFTLCVLHAGCATYRLSRWLGVGLLIAGGLSVWPQARKLQTTLVHHHLYGLGFAKEKWRTNQFIERIRNLPDIPIYSNEVVGTSFYTGRSIQSVPMRSDPMTGQHTGNLEEQLQRMKDDLTNKHGVFIDLRLGGWRGNYVSRAKLISVLNLKSVEKTPEAEVFMILP